MAAKMDYVTKLVSKLLTTDEESGLAKRVVAFGNVIMDVTLNIGNTEILERFGLQLESKGEISSAILSQIYEEASNSLSSFHPGGSALNTVRIFKDLGTDALFCGAIGSDKFAFELKTFLEEKEISACLQVVENLRTGQSICFVYKDKTALYANIGASAKFSVEYLKQLEDDSGYFSKNPEKKQIFYIEGFFVPQRFEVCRYIVNSYIKDRHILAFNLSATYIINENFEKILYLVKNSFFIFGNAAEFKLLYTKMGLMTVEEMATSLLNPKDLKIIVITNGSESNLLITNCGGEKVNCSATFETFIVPQVENVVDTTGAGDSFVAGFLHAFISKRSVNECIRFAIDVASKVITQFGCYLPS